MGKFGALNPFLRAVIKVYVTTRDMVTLDCQYDWVEKCLAIQESMPLGVSLVVFSETIRLRALTQS